MLQDISPKKYSCEYKVENPKATDILLYSNGRDYLMKSVSSEPE